MSDYLSFEPIMPLNLWLCLFFPPSLVQFDFWWLNVIKVIFCWLCCWIYVDGKIKTIFTSFVQRLYSYCSITSELAILRSTISPSSRWYDFLEQNKIVHTKENLNLNWVQGVHLFCIKVAALPNLFLQFPPNFLQIFHKLSRERHHLPHHPPNPCLVITTVEKFMLSINFSISFLLYSNSIQNRCQK